MEELPALITAGFIATVLLSLFFLYKSTRKSRIVLAVAIAWLFIQGFISNTGFYTVTTVMPPRFLLLTIPPLIAIAFLFALPRGRKWMDQWSLTWLTYFHIVRVPVELVLYGLFLHKMVPELMTFEGNNYDILSGITAPVIACIALPKRKCSNTILLIWNLICLGLLANIVASAILSAPFPFQKLAFDQPNTAILYYPFSLLPGFLVPVVLLSHLVVIRKLLPNLSIFNPVN